MKSQGFDRCHAEGAAQRALSRRTGFRANASTRDSATIGALIKDDRPSETEVNQMAKKAAPRAPARRSISNASGPFLINSLTRRFNARLEQAFRVKRLSYP